jgi:thioredoxin reductase (NADPH)
MNVRLVPLAWGIVGATIALLVLAPRSSYQPGALLTAHQQLNTNCTACHRPWHGPSNAGCVNCHGELSDNNPHSGFDVNQEDIGLMHGRSLVVSPSHNLECFSCHSEHQGATPNVSASSAFACTWCHKHPVIDKVAEHRVAVMQRQFFVRHLFKQPFNHFEHELLIKSHYPPISGGASCTFCHLVRPVQPGGHEQMSFRWLGCAGVGCHVAPQDSFMEMPESLGHSPTIIPYSGVVVFRHIKAVFVHSEGHLQSACEQCHFKVTASHDPDDRASLAILRCFDCHAHQPPAIQKSVERQSAPARQSTSVVLLGVQLPASARINARRRSSNLHLIETVDFHRTQERIGVAAVAPNEVKGLGAAVDPSLRPGRREQPRAAATCGNDRNGSDSVGLSFSRAWLPRLKNPDLFPRTYGAVAFAATPIPSGVVADGHQDGTVTACNQCHRFHAYGVVPMLDFPNPAPNFPPNQMRYFELTVYIPHWQRNRADRELGPIALRPAVFSPWWLGLVAIGLVAYLFTHYVRELPQKHESHEAVPDVAPQRSKQVPALDDTYQTSVRHLYIVGEAAGTASINLAMRSGRQVIEAIANESQHSASQARADLYDVVIVGCGPAGLGATATARVMGLKYATLEKLTPASTLRSYPRAKFVQATPIDIAEYGSFFLEGDNSREELIAEWEKIISKLELVINDREEVVGVVREPDSLVVKTARGNSYPSRSVVLAIGVRGNPRHLNLAGELSDRVFYNLIEPDEFTGRKIMVVGGGNAGAEVAQALAAERLANTVSYSFRSPVLGNVTPENADAIVALQQAKAIRVYPATALVEIRAHSVVLETVKSADGRREVPVVSQTQTEVENDIIFAMIGAELPTAFLRAIGIKMVSKGRVYG